MICVLGAPDTRYSLIVGLVAANQEKAGRQVKLKAGQGGNHGGNWEAMVIDGPFRGCLSGGFWSPEENRVQYPCQRV